MSKHKNGFSKLLKRALIVCLCLVMTLGTTVTIMAASFNGDLDGDGEVTAFDAQLLAEYQAGNRQDLDPATVIGLTVRGILDRVLGRIIDEPVEEPSEDSFEATFEVKAEEGVVTEELTLTEGNITVTVPVGVMVTGAELTLTIKASNSEEGGVNLEAGQEQKPLDIHIDGIAAENTVPVLIKMAQAMEAGLNQGNLSLYHVENGEAVAMTQVMTAEELTAHNQFYYDPATGDVTIATVSFSVYRFVSENAKLWKGGVDHNWYDAKATELTIFNADQLWSFSQIVGGMAAGIEQDSFAGKTVNLAVDINLDDEEEDGKIFYPIGYNCSDGLYEKTGVAVTTGFYTFQGTFDGQGHTIANFYQNTWEMKGDDEYYALSEQRFRDGMGLFGRIYGGTVRNLTVVNFSNDGEYATTGTIAAYADGATFENISIFNCNPRVYNIGNGGIVGCVGWYAKEAGLKTTFRNITVDNTNKISALWGSWDVACGGILGQYYPTSGQSSAGKPANGGVHFENCHVAAQIDVYNDVCANYQYYAYRYAGILIGSVRENEIIDGHEYPKMAGITAENCTVHFGDWNDYYYCELVANSLASYTHDHQMSRLEQVQSVNTDNKKIVTLQGVEQAIPTSGRVNYVVVKKTADGTWDHGDGEEHAVCYHFVNGVQHFHHVADNDNPNVYETVDGVEVLKEDKQCIYREFNNLVTGYGWGVTSKGIGDLEGVTILDRVVGDSVVKFEGIKGVTEILSGKTYTLGELFAAAENLDTKTPIKSASVQVGLIDLNKDDAHTASIKFVRDPADWTQSTVTITGMSDVQLIIQDYYFCTPTRINLSLDSHIHCLCGATTTLNQECGKCGTVADFWTPWTSETQLPTSNLTGYYYLTNDITKNTMPVYSQDIAICLNGHDVVTTVGRFVQIGAKAEHDGDDEEYPVAMSLTDCAEEQGKVTGSPTGAIRIGSGATFNMYGGIITGNNNPHPSGGGTIILNAGLEKAAVFNMYGGKITKNTTVYRGAVFTRIPDANKWPVAGEINLYGGEISYNISQDNIAKPDLTRAGGAGVYAFGPVTIGGDIKIFGNQCRVMNNNKNPDMYVRVDYAGKLIVTSTLTDEAIVNYGTHISAAENAAQQENQMLLGIQADESLIAQKLENVLYENEPVTFNGTNFYVKHVHCLCGAKTEGHCDNCDSNAVQWIGVNGIPLGHDEGYYYLRMDYTKDYLKYYGDETTNTELNICLNGHTVTSTTKGVEEIREDGFVKYYSDTFVSVKNLATLSITDCDTVNDANGKITGSEHFAAIKVLAGGTFKLYGGEISGNGNTSNSSGIVWVQDALMVNESDEESGDNNNENEGTDTEISGSGSNNNAEGNTPAVAEIVTTTRPGGKFYMYGGMITRNTMARSAVFTAVPSSNETEDLHAKVYILGGKITGNHSTNPEPSSSGGAGIYAFVPVYVGGNAVISGNTAADNSHSADIVLRNEGAVAGIANAAAVAKLVIASSLGENASINYSTYRVEKDLRRMQSIELAEGAEATNVNKIKYNGMTVSHANDTFYITGAKYCMCGKTTEGSCDSCGTEAVEWTPHLDKKTMPSGGYYYLTSNMNVGITNIDKDTTICLNGFNVESSKGGRLFNVRNGATLSITDWSETAGMLTGCSSNDASQRGVIVILEGSTFNLYNGQICGNEFTYNSSVEIGIIGVCDNATFNMYGGKITGNTVPRGTVMGRGENSVIRIFGGQITNNIGTEKNGSMSGGVGIYSFGPVTIGGDAYIYANEYAKDADQSNNENIYLRSKDYNGRLVISSDVALTADAKIDFSTNLQGDNFAEYIIFSNPEAENTLITNVLTYNKQSVIYENGEFVIYLAEEL